MSAVNFSEADFYLQQRDNDNRWRSAALFAAALHLFLFIWSFFLPDLLTQKPLIDQVVTVDLVSMPEPAPQQVTPEPPPVEENVQPAPEPVQPEKPAVAEVAIPTEPEVTPPPKVAAKPISIKPLKRKKKRAADTRLAEEKERQRKAAELREQLHRQERREQKERERRRAEAVRAQKEAEKAAEDARKALADIYRQQRQLQQKSVAASRSVTRQQGNKKVQSIVAQQYYAALYQQVQRYWVLPETRRWDTRLEATVVLTIDKSGRVIKTAVERKSQDPFFDQLVIKTINNASPMPPIPKLMKKNIIEVGLRFRPGKLEM